MGTVPLVDDLLDPISPDRPAGDDLRYSTEYDRIREARRTDDTLAAGKWEKRERKVADWKLLRELSVAMLRDRSKDLQVALWYTEAEMRLRGFPGLRDGLRLTRELLTRYWDNGLYPPMEDGPDDRSGPLEWLNNKLAEAATGISITARVDGGNDLTFVHLIEARWTGSEASCRTEDGSDIDPVKKKAYDASIAAGRISMDAFDRAVKETPRLAYEELNAQVLSMFEEYRSLEKVIDEKFGDAAPNLAACRNIFKDIIQALTDILDKKRKQEPNVTLAIEDVSPSSAGGSDKTEAVVVRLPLSAPTAQSRQVTGGTCWQDAEMLIRAGEVDKGLNEMTRLAAAETSGRSRFQRKLLLAEVCLASKRERLARSILEELAEQIDKYQLDNWESSELIGSVWIRLHKLYKRSGSDSSDGERADKLYLRLCRLDPWQALQCAES